MASSRTGSLRAAADPPAAAECFAAKHFASTAATRAVLSAVQIHGAAAHRSTRWSGTARESGAMEIMGGTARVQQVTIARHELGVPCRGGAGGRTGSPLVRGPRGQEAER
jgi:alkylation response protein AidB-like acyl-CoA dehydrogenase